MDLYQKIRSYATQPLTHQLLVSFLTEYKRPNEKLHELLSAKILAPIKKGLYMAGPALHAVKPEAFLMANHIVGPSYVSMESALSYYGLIPERVYETSSITIKSSRVFDTALGRFSYTRLPLPYYSFGIRQQKLTDETVVLIATPEKALFDKVITTSGKIIRSNKAALAYLIDDLRMNEDDLKRFDIKAMKSWIPDALKKESLQILIRTISGL